MKTCGKCGAEKPLEDFSKDSRSLQRGGDGLQASCKSCARDYRAQNLERLKQYDRRRYLEAPEKKKSAARKWRVENQKFISERRREHYAANREEFLERSAKYRQVNADSIRESQRAYRLRNQDRLREYFRQHYIDNKDRRRDYRENNRGVILAQHRARLARKKSLPAERVTVKEVALRDGAWCWLCGDELSDFDPSHMDHLIPLAADPELLAIWGVDNPGTVLANMALACPSCNIRKSNKILPCAIARYLRNLEPIEATA